MHGQVIAAWETLATVINTAIANVGSSPIEMCNLIEDLYEEKTSYDSKRDLACTNDANRLAHEHAEAETI